MMFCCKHFEFCMLCLNVLSQQELALGLDVIEHGVESTGALAQKLAHVHTLLATMPPQDRVTMHHAIEALIDPVHGGQHAASNDSQ